MKTDGHEHESEFETRLKRAFDSSVSELDGRTRSRLAQARSRALERARHAGPAQWLRGGRGLIPAGAVAAAVVAAALVWQSPVTLRPGIELADAGDWEILLGEDELEMLEELEFYVWLEDQLDEAADAADDSIG